MHQGVITEVSKQVAFWQERLDQIRLRRLARPNAEDGFARELAEMEATILPLLDDWKRVAEYVKD